MKRYQYILLDWDGNLAQTLHAWPDALDVVLRARGMVFERKELIQACGGVASFLSDRVGLPRDEGSIVLEQATEIVKQMLPEMELYPDAVDVLHELKQSGKQLAVVTSSVRPVIEPLLQKFSLAAMFDVVVCIEDVTNRKPHAEPLEKAIALMGGTKELAVMIGDTEKDILAGHNAGIDSILFYPPEHEDFYDLQELLSHRPTHVVSDFRDIIKLAR